MDNWTIRLLRAVLGASLLGAVALQLGIVWALLGGGDPHDSSAALTAVRVAAAVGLGAVQVGLLSLLRLLAMVRSGTVFSAAAFRHVDLLCGAIVAAAVVWFAVTAINAPGQRDDPGVTAIMAGIGVGILGVALIVRVLRMLLARAIRLTPTPTTPTPTTPTASGRDPSHIAFWAGSVPVFGTNPAQIHDPKPGNDPAPH
jgi:hypothetical protein